jgi:hypothetical protein
MITCLKSFYNSPFPVLAAGWAIIVLGCASTKQNEVDSAKIKINPEVRLTRGGISLTNKDGFAYGPTKLVINMTQWGKGNNASIPGIAPGKTVTVPYGEFTDDDLKRFNYARTKIMTVVVRAEVDNQKAYAVLLFPDPSKPGIRGPEKAPER